MYGSGGAQQRQAEGGVETEAQRSLWHQVAALHDRLIAEHFDSDMVLGSMYMLAASVCLGVYYTYAFFSDTNQGASEAQDLYAGTNACASWLFVVASALIWKYSYPDTVMEGVMYAETLAAMRQYHAADHKEGSKQQGHHRSPEVLAQFDGLDCCTRHFGTPMLMSAWLFVFAGIPFVVVGVWLLIGQNNSRAGWEYVVAGVLFALGGGMFVPAAYPEAMLAGDAGVVARWLDTEEGLNCCCVRSGTGVWSKSWLLEHFGSNFALGMWFWVLAGIVWVIGVAVWLANDFTSGEAWVNFVAAVLFTMAAWKWLAAGEDMYDQDVAAAFAHPEEHGNDASVYQPSSSAGTLTAEVAPLVQNREDV